MPSRWRRGPTGETIQITGTERGVISFALEGTAVGNMARQLIALGAVKNLATFRALLGKGLKQTVYAPRR